MTALEELQRHRDELLAIAAKHGATNVRVFGSAVRGEESPDSDVDFLVDFADDRGFDDLLAMMEAFEAVLGRHVDIVFSRSISPHFRPYIEAEARPL